MTRPTETRCDFSDLPASMCGGECCRPELVELPATGTTDLASLYADMGREPLGNGHAGPGGELRASDPAPPSGRPRRDLRGLVSELTQCASLHDQLGDMANGARGDDPERVSGGDTEAKPAPARADVIEHRHQLVKLLRAELARLSPAGPPPLDVPVMRMVGKLLAWLPQLDDERAAPVQGDLRRWRHRALQLLDLPQLRSRIPLGACPHVADELWSCEGLLWANVPADVGRIVWLSCDSCRDRWEVVELPSIGDVVLPLRDVAGLTGVPRGTLWHWVDDGLVSETDAGIRLGDVLVRMSHDPRQPA